MRTLGKVEEVGRVDKSVLILDRIIDPGVVLDLLGTLVVIS